MNRKEQEIYQEKTLHEVYLGRRLYTERLFSMILMTMISGAAGFCSAKLYLYIIMGDRHEANGLGSSPKE
jgi:hypothetical protein